MADAMLPAELAEVTDPLEPEDELLTADELASFALFEELKKTPSFKRFPGTTVLRKCKKGRVLVRQGDAGATAYSILSAEDALNLRKLQIKSLTSTISAKETGEGKQHQYYQADSIKELERIKARFESEVDQLEKQVADHQAAGKEPGDRHVATAELLVNIDQKKKPGLLHKIANLFSGGGKSAANNPAFIPMDGPADIDIRTKRAPLHESELFGEMSCMNRAPRSATVVAEEDCYMLEMLRNVLDMLHNDPKYQQKLDQIYRERVLDGHIRRLPIFQHISDDDYAKLKERIELVEFEAGSVVFEEHEDSDSFFVVRGGLVKVVKNAWTLVRKEEFQSGHWKEIWTELAEKSQVGLGAQFWAYMSEDLQAIAKNGGKDSKESDQQALVDAMNHFITEGTLHTDLGKFTVEIFLNIDAPQLEVDCEHFPEETKKWSELEVRTFHRAFLEFAYEGGMPRRAASSGARKILRYMGRGEGFGELGVITESPRSATIFAYDHPDGGANMRLPDSRTGAIPSRVELVKISRDDLLDLVKKSPQLQSTFDSMIERYKTPPKTQTKKAFGPEAEIDQLAVRAQSPEFEQMGLIQGQRLMLIDLDRCTRCNQCVDACVAAHHDGLTRLYLDGPRFEKYLVPLTCRSCMDPVCMIGCPVGSINRGDNGEIQIRDWCIGCEVCADQCPYGSIQMNPLPGDIELTATQQEALGGEDVKPVNQRAVVCDLCSSLPKQDPSCVYACPHDAAMRVSALEFFFDQ